MPKQFHDIYGYGYWADDELKKESEDIERDSDILDEWDDDDECMDDREDDDSEDEEEEDDEMWD